MISRAEISIKATTQITKIDFLTKFDSRNILIFCHLKKFDREFIVNFDLNYTKREDHAYHELDFNSSNSV